MTRPRYRRRVRARSTGALVLLALLSLLACLVVSPATATPSPSPTNPDEPVTAEEPEVPADPLAVRIERLTPSVMPVRGRVRVAGTIRNRSADRWEALSAYLVVSPFPMTTTEQVAAAVVSDPRTDVGDRIVEEGSYVDIPDLDPGEAAPFRLSVPVGQLSVSGDPGVYWLAVHVLGETERGRLEGADGRARTFLPLVPAEAGETELALALQLRRPTRRAPDGSLEDADGWAAALAPGGRLGRLVGLGATTDRGSLSWVVDPAVVESARSVAAGNPALSVDPEEPERRDERAGDWVVRLGEQLADQDVLALPYGDADLAALLRHGADGLVERSRTAGQTLLEELGVTATPVYADPNGLVPPAVLAELDPRTRMVLSPAATGGRGPVLVRFGGGRVLVAPTAETVEGPGPGDVRSALGVRQRLLADAALHALSEAEGPLMRALPALWNPGPRWRRAQFFAGLDVPWLSVVPLGGVPHQGDLGSEPFEDPELAEQAEAALLPLAPVEAADELVDAGAILGEVLTGNDAVDDRLARQALTSVSLWDRARPARAAARAEDAAAEVAGRLDRIEVLGPAFVTMSSETGDFPVTVVNGLDQAVSVGLRASVVGDDLRVDDPPLVELPPRSRRALRVEATARDIGVHQVTVQPVALDGTPVGVAHTLSVRSSQVGLILWLVMAVGGAVLFVAVTLRIYRRVRRRKGTHGPRLVLERR